MSHDWFGWGRLPRRTNRKNKSRPAQRRILTIESLEARDYLSVAPLEVATPDYVAFRPANGATPQDTSGPTGMTPAEIQAAYGISGVSGNGAGTTIAIVDAYNDPTITNDLHQFDSAFGLSNPTLTIENQTGGTSLPAANQSWSTEIALDVEWSHAVAPGANILLIEANSSSMSDLMAAVNTARNAPSVVAVSMSWGGSEFGGETSYDSDFTTPTGHIGVSFFVASGDDGAPASYPATSPNVVSVGGTTLSLSGSESAWSGSGGGLGADEAQPAYQKGVVTQSTTARANPDVAFDADPNTGFPVYNSYANGTTDPWGQWGGTSDAAPQWAALVSIADQQREAAGLGSLNGATQLLPALYQLPASDFHDITSGTTTGSPHYSAGPGYDLATGRGTPVANLLIAGLTTWTGGSQTTTPPAAPGNFSAQATSSSQVAVSWSLSAGATSYSVYSEVSGGQPVLDGSYSASTTSATVSNLTPGGTYAFQVVAANSAGSASTAWQTVKLPAATLAAPGDFSVRATSSSQATLSWTLSSGATGYSVYTQSGGQSVLVASYGANATSATVNNLTPGSSDSFQVVATNGTASAATAWQTVTLPGSSNSGTLSAPQNFTVTASSSSVARLSWDAVAAATGYAIYWFNGRTAVDLGQVNAHTTSVSVSNLAPGSTDKFYITAFDARSSASTGWVSVVMPKAAVLSAPQNVAAKALSSTIGQLSWSASTGALGYLIYWQDGNQLVDLGSVGANTTSVTIQGLAAGSTDSFVIVAFNATSQAKSASVSLTTPTSTTASQALQASRLADMAFTFYAADRRWGTN
ncbi:MAG TPA: fibronectin type III domain-containing protein [Pirellulales bacterium]